MSKQKKIVSKRPYDYTLQYIKEKYYDKELKIHTLRWWRGEWREWVGTHYAVIDPVIITGRSTAWLANCWKETDEGDLAQMSPTLHTRREMERGMQEQLFLDDKESPPYFLDNTKGEYLSLRNGILDIKKRKLYKHSAKYFCTSYIDIDWNPNAPSPKKWETFLSEIFNYPNSLEETAKSMLLMQQWFGCVLTGYTEHQKCLLIVGKKRSGKGTISQILQHLLGEENTVNPNLRSLSGQFGLQPLLEKRAIIINDIRLDRNETVSACERLLNITGGDRQLIDIKRKAPVSAKINANITMTSNAIPLLNDMSGVIASRFLILPTTGSFFGRENVDLASELATELPGILLWALEGFERYLRCGFDPPKASEVEQREMEHLISAHSAFRDECLVQGDRVSRSDVWATWEAWCLRNDRSTGSHRAFWSAMRRVIPSGMELPAQTHHGVRYLLGANLHPDIEQKRDDEGGLIRVVLPSH